MGMVSLPDGATAPHLLLSCTRALLFLSNDNTFWYRIGMTSSPFVLINPHLPLSFTAANPLWYEEEISSPTLSYFMGTISRPCLSMNPHFPFNRTPALSSVNNSFT